MSDHATTVDAVGTSEPSFDVDAYLRRIGYDADRTPTEATLAGIVAAHVRHIPFEGIDPMLGVAVARLDAETLQRKLIQSSRGGYCFEQNGVLGYALSALGFEVRALAGRVVWMRGDTDTLPAETHQLLAVGVPGGNGDLLVDVGFGGQTPTSPLRFVVDEEQSTDLEPFRITRHDDRPMSPFTMETRIAGTWQPVYLFSDRPRPRIDLEVASWYVSTQPTSHFVTGLNAAIIADDARWNLRGRHLSVHHRDGTTDKRALDSVNSVLALLNERFGIDTDAIPQLADALPAVLDS